MSATKAFLADDANLSAETRMLQANRTLMAGDGLIRHHAIRQCMVCNDGFTMSVQYSPGHYCNGRERFLGGDMDSLYGPLPEPRSVEIGFPSEDEPLIAEYAEEPTRAKWVDPSLRPSFGDEAKHWHKKPVANRIYDQLRWGDRLERWLVERLWPQVSNLTNTVYGWVPVEVVDEVIAKHGGLKGGE